MWRVLVLSFISFAADGSNARSGRFLVESQGPVCEGFCRAAYGIPLITWNTYLGAARAGNLEAQHEFKADSVLSKALVCKDSQASFECVQWWLFWLRLEDQMPNEPVIVHRAVIWSSVYNDEYVPDMKWWGSTTELSRERCTTLKGYALRDLSLEYYGEVATTASVELLTLEKQRMRRENGGYGVPVRMLSLRERATHSNFASCD
eukprot:6208624-Pleurochrysis_carterae.AAC.1